MRVVEEGFVEFPKALAVKAEAYRADFIQIFIKDDSENVVRHRGDYVLRGRIIFYGRELMDYLKKRVCALTLVDCLKFGFFDSALVFGIYPARLGGVGLGWRPEVRCKAQWSDRGARTFPFLAQHWLGHLELNSRDCVKRGMGKATFV